MMPDTKSNDKIYYSIGDISKLIGVKPYVLRYWETEFSELKPEKDKGGQRVYRKKDLELIKKIKYLLYDEEYTISGARKRLKKIKETGIEQSDFSKKELIEDMEFMLAVLEE